MHTVLILAHAAAGVLALATGLAALLRPGRGPGRWLPTYVVALTGMLVLLVAAMLTRWPAYDAATRAYVGALALLGVVVVAQGWRAYRLRPAPGTAPGRDHRDSLGFTVVALADGFLVVAVLDLGGPTWAVIATGVGVAAVGHLLLRRLAEADAADVAVSAPAPR